VSEGLGEDVLGADLPDGARFVAPPGGATAAWSASRPAPATVDLSTCVACGLCLPHCPTYRLTGEESASPRGRIAAMRAIDDGVAVLDRPFASFMDACLVCRACEDVCPSHAPFGRMMEAARAQIEPARRRRSRFVRWVGFHWLLTHPSLVRTSAALQPVARVFLPRRTRALIPRRAHPFARLPRVTGPPPGVTERGTVAILSGCVQDRWFHEVTLATIRVLAATGWRVVVPRGQACCGALAAHNGRMAVARRLATRAASAFADADVVVVNAAGCSAHMQTYGELDPSTALPAIDLMRFLAEHGPGEATFEPLGATVAYHDACHALRAQGIAAEPRQVLGWIPGLRVVELATGDRCCGAAGLYNVTQPAIADALQAEKVRAVLASEAPIVASANPGCTMQISAGLRTEGSAVEVVHPVQLLDGALVRA
jgi:glycolate oxidase iron-sulfur subunit